MAIVRAGVWASSYASIEVEITAETTLDELKQQLTDFLENLDFHPTFGSIGSFGLDMEDSELQSLLDRLQSEAEKFD